MRVWVAVENLTETHNGTEPVAVHFNILLLLQNGYRDRETEE